jgi:hypothetical protein
MKTLRDEWYEFRRMCIPQNATDEQVIVLKRTFYTGAYTIFKLIHALDPGIEPTPQDIESMGRYHKELEVFFNAVQRGEQ